MQQDQASKDSSHSTPPFMNAKERSSSEGDSGTYDKEMDAMRCILYLHGGKVLPYHPVALQTDYMDRWLLFR